MKKKLTKSATDKKLAGVCGGLGEYFDIDPVIFRAIFVSAVICAGCGIIAYLILALMMGQAR